MFRSAPARSAAAAARPCSDSSAFVFASGFRPSSSLGGGSPVNYEEEEEKKSKSVTGYHHVWPSKRRNLPGSSSQPRLCKEEER